MEETFLQAEGPDFYGGDDPHGKTGGFFQRQDFRKKKQEKGGVFLKNRVRSLFISS